MADEALTAIVQRMIDAGETEENIATVIQGYKQPFQQQHLGVKVGPIGFMRRPEVVSDTPAERPLMDRLASPESAEDIGRILAIPTDATRGVIANLPKAMEAAKQIPREISQAWNKTRESVSPFAQELVEHKLGMSPEAINLKTARLRLQTARSSTRQAAMANKMPVEESLQSQASDMVNKIQNAQSPSSLLDSSGKPISSASTIGDWENKFISSIKGRLDSGGTVNGNQFNVLKRIYNSVVDKTMAIMPLGALNMGEWSEIRNATFDKPSDRQPDYIDTLAKWFGTVKAAQQVAPNTVLSASEIKKLNELVENGIPPPIATQTILQLRGAR